MNSCLILKYIKKCLNFFKLLIITIKDCIKNSFCFICNCSNDNSSYCNCYIEDSFEKKEDKFCLFYKEKKEIQMVL